MNVDEIFVSFQGEGQEIGRPALFLRLNGCNLNCEFCDTVQKNNKNYTVETLQTIILQKIKNNNLNYLVITGGEPMLQYEELFDLLENLRNYKIQITIETNGSYMKKLPNCNYTISPKQNKKEVFNYYKYYPNAVFKFVISNEEDLLEVVSLIKKYNYKKIIYLQPEFSNAEEIVNMIMKQVSILPNNIRLSGQLHKYLNQR